MKKNIDYVLFKDIQKRRIAFITGDNIIQVRMAESLMKNFKDVDLFVDEKCKFISKKESIFFKYNNVSNFIELFKTFFYFIKIIRDYDGIVLFGDYCSIFAGLSAMIFQKIIIIQEKNSTLNSVNYFFSNFSDFILTSFKNISIPSKNKRSYFHKNYIFFSIIHTIIPILLHKFILPLTKFNLLNYYFVLGSSFIFTDFISSYQNFFKHRRKLIVHLFFKIFKFLIKQGDKSKIFILYSFIVLLYFFTYHILLIFYYLFFLFISIIRPFFRLQRVLYLGFPLISNNFQTEKNYVLVFIGSKGSNFIDREFLSKIIFLRKDYTIYYQFRKLSNIKNYLHCSNIIFFQSRNDIEELISKSALVICRPTAHNLALVNYYKKPVFLIPSSNSLKDYEINNSKYSGLNFHKEEEIKLIDNFTFLKNIKFLDNKNFKINKLQNEYFTIKE